ncbi:MAG: type II secretion system F family protein [Nanoarchaeota archaeon]|nr:type II secretion system F family protein [Nanoarchaeota archaeon]
MKPYKIITKFVPSPIKKRLRKLLLSYMFETDPDLFIGFITLTSVLLGLVGGFTIGFFFKIPFWIPGLAIFFLVNASAYLWVSLLVDKRTRIIEDFLPDALFLVSSNLKAGMTPDKALLLGSRPEFGPLKSEIDLVGKKVALGKNIGSALMDMTDRVPSKRLLRAVELINSGLNSGGSLATLLESTASHLKDQFLVDKKIKAGVSMYIIFIFAAAAVITPVLLGLSSVLVEILRSSLSQLEIPTTVASTLPIKGAEVTITSKFLISYIITFLVVNNFMAAMLLGLIAKGKQKEGIHYYIPMVLLAIPIFLLVSYIASKSLGGLFNF